MTFLAPAWAAGLAAAALPWLAHLLGRGTARPAPFPAVRFVRQAEAETRRLSRLRDAGLLALRTAAIAAIALAFMQPVWRTTALPAGADDALGRHVVLVLDRTASMQRAERGHTLLDQARRQAVSALRQLAPADRASVVLLDRHPAPLLPEPTANVADLIDRLERASPTHEHGDVAAALRRARQLHEHLDEPARYGLRIELFTDAQRSQWAEVDLGAALEGLPATVRVHRLGDVEPNDALHGPAVEPREPVAGQSARVSVRATRFADRATHRTVELRVGERRKTRRIELEPFVEKALDFGITFDEPGRHVIELRFADGDDALAADDATGRVVSVRPHRRVRLLTQSDSDDPATAAFFVRRALAPSPGAGRVDLSVETVAGFTDEPRDTADVLVLVEAGEFDTDLIEMMRDHVAAGGGAIWIIDSPQAAATLARFDQRTGESPIISRAGNEHRWRGAAPRSLGTGRFDTPALSAFEGPVRAALLNQSFNATLEAQARDEAAVLLRFADGPPALAMHAIGAGRLAVFAADLAPEATDLAQGPLLVPLLHQLLRHIDPGEPAPPNPHPGDAGPHQRIERLGLHAQHDEQTDALTDGVWYELDPRQSDLRVLGELHDHGNGRPTAHLAGESAMHEPREWALWPWAMLAALVLLMFEPIALMARRGRWA